MECNLREAVSCRKFLSKLQLLDRLASSDYAKLMTVSNAPGKFKLVKDEQSNVMQLTTEHSSTGCAFSRKQCVHCESKMLHGLPERCIKR